MKIWGYLIAGTLLLAGTVGAYTLYKNPALTKIEFEKFSLNVIKKSDNPN